MPHRKRVLFFAEAVTLAHVARPLVLAAALARDQYEVHLACAPRYRSFTESGAWHTLPLSSISPQRFTDALARGTPVYDATTLRRYVAEDTELIRSVRPDLIVGDFRLSLSVSARKTGVPYATITNAYWSPSYRPRHVPVPVLPITRFLPIGLSEVIFRLARPAAFAWHCRPLNEVRRENGLAPLGSDLRRVYTDADHVLYADVPAMFPIESLPDRHHYVGPVIWSPPGGVPSWWDELPPDLPIVYVTLGSSGSVRLAETVLRSLASERVTVIASTAGAPVPPQLPGNARAAEYLPGIEAVARARLVICNGGSPTSQQALVSGVPVLGIASNLDQFLNMCGVEAAGAGLTLRADRATAKPIRSSVRRILDTPEFARAAATAASKLLEYDVGERLRHIVSRCIAD